MKNKNFHVAIFSTLFAVLLWLCVNMGYEYQFAVAVPLVVDNLKPNRALVRPVPQTLNVKVRGTGWQMLGLSFMPDVRYVIDVGEISNRFNFATSRDMLERLKLPQGLHPIDIKPETIAVVLDEKVRKNVPLEPVVRLSFREGYGLVGDIKTNPDSVTLTGPRSLVERIARWQTEPLEFSNLKSGVNARADVSDTLSYTIVTSPTSVALQIDVQPTAEKMFKGIPVAMTQVPSNRLVVLIPPKIDIIIRGGIEQVAAASQKDFSAYIEYRSVLIDTTGSLQPIVTTPKNIRVVAMQPNHLQYVVRK